MGVTGRTDAEAEVADATALLLVCGSIVRIPGGALVAARVIAARERAGRAQGAAERDLSPVRCKDSPRFVAAKAIVLETDTLVIKKCSKAIIMCYAHPQRPFLFNF